MWTSNRSTDGQASGLPLQKQRWKILAMLWRLFTSSWVAEGLTTRPPAQNPKKRWCSGWKHFGPLICSKSFYAFYFKLHTYNSCYCLKQRRCWNSSKKSAFMSPPMCHFFGMFSRLWLCHAIHFMLSDLDTLNVVLEWHITIWTYKTRMGQSLMQSVQHWRCQQPDPNWKKKSSNAPTRVGMIRLNE